MKSGSVFFRSGLQAGVMWTRAKRANKVNKEGNGIPVGDSQGEDILWFTTMAPWEQSMLNNERDLVGTSASCMCTHKWTIPNATTKPSEFWAVSFSLKPISRRSGPMVQMFRY